MSAGSSVVKHILGHIHRVTQTFALGLLHRGHFQLRIILLHVLDDAFAPLTDNEHDFIDADGDEPIENVAENRLSGHVHQRFRLGMGERPQPRADARHGQNCLQRASSSVNCCLQPPGQFDM